MSDDKTVSKVEKIKLDSLYLRGTIQEEIQEDSRRFSEENTQVLKFHGVYQQDDRDLRRQLKQEGQERHYMMMIRARIPGGVLNANQYLEFDRLADTYGNRSLRITTRQTFQLHGVLKRDLKSTIRSINDVLITTLGGCGDQVRNIVGCARLHVGPFYDSVRADLLKLVDALSAKTNAYHEIWLDGEKLKLSEDTPEEPLYGGVYLPRKFKIAFAYEGDNCVDVYSNDVGIVAHRDMDDVVGYTLLVGGGMGRTASDKQTHPRLASPLCFVERGDLVSACTAILLVQRDHGNRAERKFARLKYLIELKGLEWFHREVEQRIGRSLAPPKELKFISGHDHVGRQEQEDGRISIGVFVPNGRLHDTESVKLKSALHEIVRRFLPEIRLTTQQNIILAGLSSQSANEVEKRLQEAGVMLAENVSKVKLNSMACPAMPTCGLAIAESERAFPSVIQEFERTLSELGLEDHPITVRMTGCANGCARPYISEIGFVGRVIGKYDVFLGANPSGARMNQLFKEMVPLDHLVKVVKPVLKAYKDQKINGESFGDFCNRTGVEQLRQLNPLGV